ncbi:MAG: TA system VapC family ribonuclease toxin [Galbitalea sp.]
MILIDANILVYAFSSSMPEHQAAYKWLDTQLRSRTHVALPWESTMGFVRLVSNGRMFSDPSNVATAWEQIEALLAEPNVWIPTPTPQHAQLVGELVRSGKFTTKDVPDIQLAALAISHGLKLASHDQGFARFEGLRWIDPLAA